MLARRWPQVRAGLIAAALAIGLVDGCPVPAPGDERAWQRGFAPEVRAARDALMRPLRWVNHGLRFSQRWALFQVASRDRYRLEVTGQRADGTWHVLYRGGDPAHQAYADVFAYDRLKNAWRPTDRAAARYPEFARWLGRRILAERPELVTARLWFERIVIDRGTVRGTGTYVLHVDTTREAP